MTFPIKHHTGPDPAILRFLDCEDRKILRFACAAEIALKMTKGGWVAEGLFADGRAWGVAMLLYGHARLHVWTPGESINGTSDLTFDYHHHGGAILAALEWEGIGEDPLWWHRCRQTGRRRYYQSDGTYREETRD